MWAPCCPADRVPTLTSDFLNTRLLVVSAVQVATSVFFGIKLPPTYDSQNELSAHDVRYIVYEIRSS